MRGPKALGFSITLSDHRSFAVFRNIVGIRGSRPGLSVRRWAKQSTKVENCRERGIGSRPRRSFHSSSSREMGWLRCPRGCFLAVRQLDPAGMLCFGLAVLREMTEAAGVLDHGLQVGFLRWKYISPKCRNGPVWSVIGVKLQYHLDHE